MLKLMTAKDVACELGISLSSAKNIVTEIRKEHPKGVTILHLYDYLGITKLNVISELIGAKNS